VARKPLDYENPATLTLAPSGLQIAYFVEPRRAYALRPGDEGEWTEVPSVTTVLKVLDKPALPWWGMKVGIDGVLQLAQMGVVRFTADGKLAVPHIEKDEKGKIVVPDGAVWEFATQENLVMHMTRAKLTTNHVLEDAGSRGVNVHDAFEAWAATGKVPNPAELREDGQPLYAPEEQPYVEGLRKFVVDVGDNWLVEGSEIAVASYSHGFAGRYDLRGKFTADTTLLTRTMTANGDGPLKRARDYKQAVVPEGARGLLDLKTSKSIYSTHLMQLEAYEGAGVECGLDPTDFRAVVHVTQFGTYQFKRARATYDDFLAILHTWHTINSVEEALRS
jgi:hypothetical protein